MPSSSKSQQRFMGMERAAQKGELKNPSKSVKKAAKSMDKGDVDDFASTKHKGLPNKVKREQRVRELIRKMVREMMDESLPTKITDKHKKMKHKSDTEGGDDFYDHHVTHSGPHITGIPAEDDTIDWDDEDDDNEGGLQRDKDKSKRGYEPVKKQELN